MATQMLAINPDKRDDIYYRYKMPAVQTKVEGHGNGIKTVIPNIHEICIAINRPEEVLMKFFQFELGAQRTVSAKDDKFLLMGSHTGERIQEKVDDFIRKFVLCRQCGNPETQVHLEVNKKGVPAISMTCGACGKFSKFDGHRLVMVMAQHYQKHPELTKAAAGAAAGGAQTADESGAAAAAQTSSSAAPPVKEISKSTLSDDREDPKVVFARDLEEMGNLCLDHLINRVVQLLSQYNLTEIFGPPLILNALLIHHKNDFISALSKFGPLLRRFATVPELFNGGESVSEKEISVFLKRERQIQMQCLKECERICADNFSPDKLPIIMFVLFIEGVLKDVTIARWIQDTKPTKKVDQAVSAEMRKLAEPLVEWLGVSEEAVNAK